jgi:AraC-like DNA-binding protein
MEEYLADEVSLLSLAGLAQLSPYHFSRAFKQSFGMPPHQYLTSRRIERAKTSLAERKLSVRRLDLMSDLARQARLPPPFANTPVKRRPIIAAASHDRS